MSKFEYEIRNIIAQLAGVSPGFAPDAHIYWDVGMSSVNALELITELEGRYGLTIPDAEFVRATSVRELSDLVTRLVSARVPSVGCAQDSLAGDETCVTSTLLS